MQLKRINIIGKDLQVMLGCSGRSARRIMQKIRLKLNKKKYQIITVTELSDYLGIPESKIIETLKLGPKTS